MTLRPLAFLAAAGALSFSGLAAAQDDSETGFNDWKDEFRATAIEKGIPAGIYDREMESVTRIPRVMELNADQPEFTKAIWEYLDIAVSDTRVSNGLNNYSANKELLAEIEAAYGVDAEIITAIWGLESAYGAILGNYDVLSALATLGYEGRRTSFGRDQLVAALEIITKDYADRDQLKGSWAGAMGQTQFIPTTYLAYAVDQNADGRRNLWADLPDVFGSTANYLRKSGYTADQPWGFEVTLPDDFDYSTADRSIRKSAASWSQAGVTKADGTALGDHIDLNEEGFIFVPAGSAGPAFIAFSNFNAILRYNNSTSYALGIGLLSDHIAGRATGFSKDWPRKDRPLSLSERKALQQALADAGYDPGPVDGIIGAGTRAALRKWQAANGMEPDGYASDAVLEALQG